jgi:hypothetical protein
MAMKAVETSAILPPVLFMCVFYQPTKSDFLAKFFTFNILAKRQSVILKFGTGEGWKDRVKNEVLRRVKEEKNILLTIKRRKALLVRLAF